MRWADMLRGELADRQTWRQAVPQVHKHIGRLGDMLTGGLADRQTDVETETDSHIGT